MTQRRSRSLVALFSAPIAVALVLGIGAMGRPGSAEGELTMTASLSSRKLDVRRADSLLKEYDVAVGHPTHPTPAGRFTVRKIVWNPAWRPPDAAWARGRKPAGPNDPHNPMKLVKIFFQEPDYYIHGTNAVESLGEAASHGCLRMDPNEAGDVALMLMDNAGISRDWDWVKGLLHMGEQRVVSLSQPVTLTVAQ